MGGVSSFLVSLEMLRDGYVFLLEVSNIDHQYSVLQNPDKDILSDGRIISAVMIHSFCRSTMLIIMTQ